MNVTAAPAIIVYLRAVSVVNNSLGLDCNSAIYFSLSRLLLRSRARSSAVKEKKAASEAEARDVNNTSVAARKRYRKPDSCNIRRNV